MLRPPPLSPGDTISVFAASSPFEPTLALRGLGWLAERYRLRFSRRIFDTHGYLAGTDSARLDELCTALHDPRVKALVAMRGGYGINRIAHRIDWSVLRTQPKWIVGFSDVTALHVEAASQQTMSLHATMVAQLGRADHRARSAWLHSLESHHPKAHFPNLVPWSQGLAHGPLFGGNLTVLHACAAARRLHVPPHAILFLEDIGERPYRIDRYISTLRAGGYFENVAGIVIGNFTDCRPGPEGLTIHEVLRACLHDLHIPIAVGLPCGHEQPNEPLILGAHAQLNVTTDAASLDIDVD